MINTYLVRNSLVFSWKKSENTKMAAVIPPLRKRWRKVLIMQWTNLTEPTRLAKNSDRMHQHQNQHHHHHHHHHHHQNQHYHPHMNMLTMMIFHHPHR